MRNHGPVNRPGFWSWAAALSWSLSAPAIAGVSASSALSSDYDYRGVTQTGDDAAAQFALDFNAAHAHLQCWTSNVRYDDRARFYGSAHTEVALTANIPVGHEHGWSGDVGVSEDIFPGLKPNSDYDEGYVTLAHGRYSSSVHYAWDYDHLPTARGAYYIEANASWPMWARRLLMLAHVGESGGPYWREFNGRAYQDYSLGVARRMRTMEVNLRYVGTRRYAPIPFGQPLSGAGRLVLTVSATWPIHVR